MKRGSVSATVEASDTWASAITKLNADTSKLTIYSLITVGNRIFKIYDMASKDFNLILYSNTLYDYEIRLSSSNAYVNGNTISSNTIRSDSNFASADKITLYY